MKTILIALFIVSVGIASSYAGGFMLLHVGSADGNGGASVGCDGSINLSTGCPQPMLGVL